MSMMVATMMLAAQATPPPLALAPLDLADAKCVAAMTLLGEQVEEKDKDGMQGAMMFFIGKLFGRSGAGALGAAMEPAVAALKASGEAAIPKFVEACVEQIGEATKGM